jgi:hypothetical protein
LPTKPLTDQYDATAVDKKWMPRNIPLAIYTDTSGCIIEGKLLK